MKRFWIGITVLALLLGAGFLSSFLLERHHEPIRKALQEATEAALEGNVAQAAKLTENAERQWEHCRKWTEALVEHGILEEVECLLAEARVYIRRGDAQGLAGTCARLENLIEAIAESHHTSWQNVL